AWTVQQPPSARRWTSNMPIRRGKNSDAGTGYQTKNPPVRRVIGANQHHGQKCIIAEGRVSRKNSYREKAVFD
ncbi:hypothetical protein, partial [Mesorhizobium sp. M7A.F.Ca.CA.001.14.1.1]|uniref:hypothetical protein n=1 Tax=Mesorhizobium sp. M7A.F.Ca.CA.001.14.1.1 TaxID=2496706 RepID=UPI0019D41E2E